ncbi:MAG: hypothetical protein IJ745_00550 [Bacteroidales bacterium]|nr:hypothetical protein [Bacteroidales bacterium]
MSHLLSKSKYIRGLQCDRALWLDVYRPGLARYTREQMRRFDAGREFEYAFKAHFANGIDIAERLGRKVDDYPALTADLLATTPDAVLFEAGFLYDQVLVLADVVRRCEDGSLDIFEVKSGSTLTDTYRRDAAVQYYVVSHCCRVNSFCIVHAAGQSEDTEHAEFPNGRFSIVDLTDELAAQADTVAANIAIMKDILAHGEPATPTGQHCLEPYACPYQHYCQQGVRQLALF